MPLGAAGGALVISNPARTLVRNLYLKRNGSFSHSFFFLQKKEWEKKENADQVSLRFAGAPPAAECTPAVRRKIRQKAIHGSPLHSRRPLGGAAAFGG